MTVILVNVLFMCEKELDAALRLLVTWRLWNLYKMSLRKCWYEKVCTGHNVKRRHGWDCPSESERTWYGARGELVSERKADNIN